MLVVGAVALRTLLVPGIPLPLHKLNKHTGNASLPFSNSGAWSLWIVTRRKHLP